MKKELSVLFLCFLLLSGCANQTQTASEELVRHISIQTVSASDYTNTVTLSGNVVPIQTVKLSFKIPGIVSEISVKEGDEIKAGQSIAALDQNEYQISVQAAQAQVSTALSGESAAQAQIEGAQAQLETADVQIATEIPTKINQAKAQLDLVQTNYDRVKTMVDQGIAAQNSLDEITTQLEVAKNTYQQALDAQAVAETKRQAAQAQLEAAKAQYNASGSQTQAASAALALANSNIHDTKIQSPIDGVILQKIVEPGEVISAGYPIVAIGSIDQVWVEIGVTDEYVNTLKKGQKAEVYVYGIDQILEGTVDEVSALADAATRTFSVKILVDNTSRLLKPGMICKVDVILGGDQKILIPVSSVIHLADGSAVFVYLNDTRTVEQKMIETGEIRKDKIEVLSGLNFGDELVIEGQYVLRNGDKVRIQSEQQAEEAESTGEMGQ